MSRRGVAAAAVLCALAGAAPARAEALRKACGLDGVVLPCKQPRELRAGPEPRRLVYMNRNGGLYSPGAVTNSSQNIASAAAATGSIAAYEWSDTSWNNLMTCVRGHFDRWNVEITDVDPGDVPHIESVVGGSPEDIGLADPPGAILLGIASIDGFCSVTERGIAFTFAENHQIAADLCITVVHEVGHVAGLEHEMWCEDVMSYLDGCTKGFADHEAYCGEDTDRDCSCGTPMQNTVPLLFDRLGPNEQEPPTVTIASPADGATVPPGFTVEVAATDNYEVALVELLVDDALVASDLVPPYLLTVPSSVLPGPHTITARALDKSSNAATAVISVTMEVGCAGDGDCAAFETCVQGVCTGDVGAGCTTGIDCASGLCVVGDSGQRFCTEICEPAASSCPEGYSCQQAGGGTLNKCWPSGGDDGGGCATAGGRPGAPLALGLGLWAALALLWLRGRRKR